MRGAAARAPELSVSQPSAGQLTGWIPVTERDPTEPCRASRHSTGVAAADTSVQRRPGTPISTTCRTAAVCGAAPAPGALITTATASAARADPAASALARIGCTRSTVSSGRAPAGRSGGAAAPARGQLAQMFWLAVRDEKLGDGVGVADWVVPSVWVVVP